MRTIFSLSFLVLSLGACLSEDDSIPPDPVEQDTAEEISEDGRVLIDPLAQPTLPSDEQCLNAIGKDDSTGCVP